MITEFRNKFSLGDIVQSKKYDIERGQIISIETHVGLHADGFEITAIDYDILHADGGGNFGVDHISEGWIESI